MGKTHGLSYVQEIVNMSIHIVAIATGVWTAHSCELHL